MMLVNTRVQIADDTRDELDQKLVSNMAATNNITARALKECVSHAIS